MIHARGEDVIQNSIRFRHPFGYLGSEILLGDGTQLMIGFGGDAERCDPADLAAMQASLDEILPGYEVLDATAHDWFADEFSLGTWAIHRPGWYEHHHAAMRRPEGNLILAGSDLANGWAGFIDGAIESGLQRGRLGHLALKVAFATHTCLGRLTMGAPVGPGRPRRASGGSSPCCSATSSTRPRFRSAWTPRSSASSCSTSSGWPPRRSRSLGGASASTRATASPPGSAGRSPTRTTPRSRCRPGWTSLPA